MGSVLDVIECPNCKQEATLDFYYKTGEEYVFCQNCGYYKNTTIINREKTLNELTDDDWDISENKHPFAAYRVSTYGSIGYHCGSLDSEKAYDNLKLQIAQDPEINYFSLSRFVDGEIKEETIINAINK